MVTRGISEVQSLEEMENPGQSTVLGMMVMLWTVMMAVNPWVSISVKVHESE